MKTNLILLCILVFFLVTRFYSVNSIPPSVYWDEASIGYNAYSVLTTGKDEWGNLLPLHFRAFGEFKLPVYIYSVVLSEVFFGLNEFSVRLPAIVYSLGIILLVYLLTLKIFKSKFTAIMAAFFMAISPWFFLFSRSGYEMTAGLFFYLLSIYFYLSKDKKKYLFIFSVIALVLSCYSYNSFRVISIPTMILLLVLIIYQKSFKLFKWQIFFGLIMFLLSLFPIAKLYILDSGLSRVGAIGISSEGNFFINFVTNYVKHFNPNFLIFNGDSNLRSHVPGLGQIFIIDLPFILLGIYFLLKKRQFLMWLPVFFLLLGPIPAAITKESPHSLRAILMVPGFVMLAAAGVQKVLEMRLGKFILTLIVLSYLVIFGLYFRGFVTNYVKLSSLDWQYPYKRIFIEYQSEFKNYDKIFISDSLSQPYIFGLFYLQYNPSRFRGEVEFNPVDKWGFSTVNKFSNFIFSTKDIDNVNGRLLIFSDGQEKINEGVKISEIKDLSNKKIFDVYEQSGRN